MSGASSDEVLNDDEMSSEDHAKKFPPLPTRKQSTIDDTILSPGAVKINVKGAFIVEEEVARADTPTEDGAQHDTDIRLPNHSAVVSHVALDVGLLLSYWGRTSRQLTYIRDRLAAHLQNLSTSPVSRSRKSWAAD